ncbi:lipase family alpha/beta hydrolase [Gordonia terrae]|uniref:lipase family alpha/beta hydrolase n=1 Tax=Gordonia terrae TaxID=2055 RepID=UPI003F6CC567
MQNLDIVGLIRSVCRHLVPPVHAFADLRSIGIVLLSSSALVTIGIPAAVPIFVNAEPQPGRNPVVLVHGWTASRLLPPRDHDFEPLRAALQSDGHSVYAVELPGDVNSVNARVIAQTVAAAQTDSDGRQVDLVAHSMGGLSARHYIKYLGGTSRIGNYVSMGTGQYGWLPTCVLPARLGGEMCPNSTFLARLNHGDDTPGMVRYTTLRTVADDELVPGGRDRALDGGACVVDRIEGGPHIDEPKNPTMIALVREALDGACPGAFVNLPAV